MQRARRWVRERVIDCRAAKRIIVLVNSSAVRASTHTISQSHMGPFETIYINETVAACNGGGGPLGHPRVFLNLGREGKVECPYCSRLFVNRAMQEPAGGATTPPRTSEERNI
jgi:uncharacterized Zn-finger protein